MKQFNLEEYLRLKEEGKEPKIVTRDGRSARIICTDRKSLGLPLVVLVNFDDAYEHLWGYTDDGTRANNSDKDLFFAPVKHEGWGNIHQSDGMTWIGNVFSTEIEAKGEGCVCKSYVATIKIEWTE